MKKGIDLIDITMHICFVRDFMAQDDKTKAYLQKIAEELKEYEDKQEKIKR